MNQPEYVTMKDVAKMLKVDLRTLQRWVKAGDLVPTRLPGNMIRFNTVHLNSWLDKRTAKKMPAVQATGEKK